MKEDQENSGLVQVDRVVQLIKQRNIGDLQPSEVDKLMSYMDRSRYGFIVISNFMQKITELAQETEMEVKMRRFAKTIGNQGINLKIELGRYSNTGTVNIQQFKRSLKALPVAFTDSEIKELFDYSINMQHQGNEVQAGGQVEIYAFAQMVQEAYK